MRVELDPEAGLRDPAYNGRVVKLLERARGRVLGVYRELDNGAGRALPVEKRGAAREIFIPQGLSDGAKEGELVALELLREGRFGAPAGRVVERLGSVASERAVSLIALAAHNIPHVFPQAALAEAEAARPATMANREDWRALPLVTIDPPDAKDHDDAVHAALDSDPANPGGFVLTVAIADVAYYVRANSPPSTARRKRAAIRSISPTASCRCCPSGSPTTCARCGRTKIARPTRLAPQCCSLQPELRPHAATLITLADSGRYPMMAARDANLLYVRDKVALTNREQKAQRK